MRLLDRALEFRFTLSHEIEGTEAIDEPVGWDSSKFNLKRDPKYHSVAFEYTSGLRFYFNNGRHNGGAEFILTIEEKYGIDTQIKLTVEVSSHNSDFAVFYIGRLNLEDLTESELYVECNMEQDDFFTTFNQRTDLQVSFKDNKSVDGIDLQAYAPYTLNMHSKVLTKRTETLIANEGLLSPTQTQDFTINAGLPGLPDPGQTGIGNQPDTEFNLRTSYVAFDFSSVNTDEVAGNTYGGAAALDVIPSPILTIAESGLHSFDIRLDVDILMDSSAGDTSLVCGGTRRPGLIQEFEVRFYLKAFDAGSNPLIPGQDTPFHTIVNNIADCDQIVATGSGIATYSLEDFQLNVGDEVFLYAEVDMEGNYERRIFATSVQYLVGYILKEGSYLNIRGKTFTSATTAPAMRVHDVFQNLCNKITNRNDSFYSDTFGYIGAPYHSYAAEGVFSDFAIQNGFNIRNFDWEDRPLQLSFIALFESLHAIFGLSLSFEVINGTPTIRVEKLTYSYDKSINLYFDNVRGLKRTIAKELYYNQIIVGYEEWKPEAINGLDEFNTNHTYSTALKSIGSPLVLKSKVIASGSLIEVTRRNQYNETVSTDTKYDDALFIIALNKTDPTIAEKNENFDTVNNLLSPETSYNLRLWPAYNLLRHGSQINGALLKKIGSSYNFQSGEGNYKVAMEIDSSEILFPGSYNAELLQGGENIPWVYANLGEVDPLWECEYFEFNYPLSFQEFNNTKANKNKAIAVNSDIHPEGYYDAAFIVDLEYEPVKGVASFKCLKASTLPFNYVPEDADTLLLQDGFDLLMEDGSLILL